MPAPKVRSKDQAQQHLRDHKREWNSSYKDFSQRLKSFKDGLNGRGNARANIPPSNIKDPLPPELGNYLGQLASEFQGLIGDAQSIIGEQVIYSKTRRKRQPKAPPGATPTPTEQPVPIAEPSGTENANEALSRLGSSRLDAKIASNYLTRFWQYMTAIFRNDFERQRIALLAKSVRLRNSLLDFEGKVLTLGLNNIPIALARYRIFTSNVDIFVSTLQRTMEAVSEKVQQANSVEENIPAKPKQPAEPQVILHKDDISAIKQDVHELYNLGVGKEYILKLLETLSNYTDEEDPEIKERYKQIIIRDYKEFVRNLISRYRDEFGPDKVNSLADILAILRNNRSTADLMDDRMVKLASNFVTRFLRRQLMKAIPFNETASTRLEIVEQLDSIKKIVKQFMIMLDENMEGSAEELMRLSEELQSQCEALKEPMHTLSAYYMKDMYREHGQNEKGKDKKLIENVMTRKMRRDLMKDV